MASHFHIKVLSSLIIIPILFCTNCFGIRCLNNYKVPEPQYLHYNEKTLDFTLKTSKNIGHQLTTEVLKIFLEEVLGYMNIKMIEFEESKSYSQGFKNILNSINPFYDIVPKVLVDINVPITPDMDLQDLINLQTFTDIGNLSPVGRYAWFVPKQFTKIFPNAEYWKFFKDASNTAYFDLNVDEYINLLRRNSINDSTKRFFCEEDYCKEGIYTPPHCKNMNNNQTCGLMLTSYPELSGFITSHIVELKLYMKVIWLGDNLRDVVDKLTNSFNKAGNKKSLIFMEWTPGYFTLDLEKFTTVSVPSCESFKSIETIGCKYEMTRITKLVWPSLQFIAKSAIELIHKMRFNSAMYKELLKSYKNNKKNVNLAACNWMHENIQLLDMWAPRKRELYIGGIFPLTEGFYNPEGITIAAIMAQEAINRNSSILPGYDLNIILKDGKCKSDAVMKVFNDYIYSLYYTNLIGVLGPACSETVEPLAGLSKHYSTIVMSYSAEGSYFSNRLKYPYFFRTIGENRQYRHVYLTLFKEFGWKQVAALTEDGQKYTEYISSMENLFHEHGISLVSNMKFPREREESSMANYLENLKSKNTKIIIADINDQVARIILCQAYKLKMTSYEGYVWFLPPWLYNDWYNTTHYNKYNGEKINCTIDEMQYTINGYFSLNFANFAQDNQMMQENITVREWRNNYKNRLENETRFYKKPSQNKKDLSSSYAGYAYDAVWTYALAADKLLKSHPKLFSNIHSYNTTQTLVKIIGDSDYDGVSGHIKFYGGASRFSIININQWIGGEKIPIGNFHPEISTNLSEVIGGTLNLNISCIQWFTKDGLKPDDGSMQYDDCIFSELARSLNVSCSSAIIIVNIISFSLLGMVLIIALFVLKRKYDKKIRMTVEYMQSMGIDKQAIMNMTNLDKWETSRENVIINRKIGEGAFGTVYGGEAIIGEGWVPVAVKTLKVGSTTEQKLDFLSEAESMKRFDHKNIVKLLGVCTKSEPVFTIMEFMLYGDLKTYLLARRHLVNEKYQDESEEVSSRKLTAMALDVARALSYLAELKYVHRDIACRNCLVNSQRIVKVGDFGMTRLIFENDYYRFSRKGLLPVRWMAPESLGLGIFTPASDIWSYGVLLYEIITFGGFPFQGLSNNQVLEAVKEGKTLTIPKGVKPQLEGLMKSCWNKEYKTRPQASEIAEFIANSPRLLSPCLDVPISSVHIEYPDEFEILPELISGPPQGFLLKRDLSNKENDSTIINSLRFDNPNYVSGDFKLDKVVNNRKTTPNINNFLKENIISHDETEPFV